MPAEPTILRTGTRRRPRIALIRRDCARDVDGNKIKAFTREVLDAAGARADEMTLVLSGDEEVKRLNGAFRGKDRTTDILSFPGEALPEGRVQLGELIISVDKARRQAAQRHHSLLVELKYLVINGVLHLMGFDHETDDGEMEQEERRLRRRLLHASMGVG